MLAIGALLEAVEDKDQLQERPVPRATVWMIRDADRAVAVERNVCWQPRREQDTLVFFRHLDRGIKDRMSDCQDQLRRLPEQQPESRGNVVRRGALTRERLFS